MKYFLPLLFSFFIGNVFAQTHYIVDTDMGFDDWMAVMFALKQPAPIDGITVDCVGETRCPQGAYNAEKLTYLAKRAVPIAFGKIRPETRYAFPAPIRDFATKMNVPHFDHIHTYPDLLKINAAQFIYEDIMKAAKNHYTVSIISIGTAANIADAWKIATKNHTTKLFRQGLKMIYKGGGAFGEIEDGKITNKNIPGNIAIPGLKKSDNTVSEWNIYADAPAMSELVRANLPITFIPNSASNQVPMTKTVYESLKKTRSSVFHFDADAERSMTSPPGNWKSLHGCDFWDTLATVAAFHPEIVSKQYETGVNIVLKPGNHYAQTESVAGGNLVTVYYRVNPDLFYKELFASTHNTAN